MRTMISVCGRCGLQPQGNSERGNWFPLRLCPARPTRGHGASADAVEPRVACSCDWRSRRGPNGAQLAAGIVFQNSVTNAIAVWEHPTQVGRGLDGKAVDTRDSLCGLRRMDRARASASPVVQQLFVSEPFNNTIAVINLVVVNGPTGSVSRISSPSLNLPVDLAAVQRDTDNPNWVSNTTLDDGSDFYVANRGNNTIVRMQQDGTVVAVRRVSVGNNASLNGITTSTDGKTIYVTVTGPGNSKKGGVLALPAF